MTLISSGDLPLPSTSIRIFATVVVLIDVITNLWWYDRNIDLHALVGLTGVLLLSGGSNAELRLNSHPHRGWKYWFQMGCLWGVTILILCLLGAFVFWMNGWRIPILKYPPNLQNFVHMCLSAPLSEEVIYRALFVIAFRPTLGEWGTIFAGGLLFAAVHHIYGNPGIDNQVAGFLLMWAFLKSKSLLVPIAMHSAGNFIAFLAHSSAWYWEVLQGASH